MSDAGRVSRVLFLAVISLARGLPRTVASSPPRLLSTSGLGEQPGNGPFGDCCGEDCPFHPGTNPVIVSVALTSTNRRRADLDCQRRRSPLPWFDTRHPALCSSDFPLASLRTPATALPDIAHGDGHPSPDRRCRRGDLNSHGVAPTTP